MKIRINGVDADIQLEEEKNVGDILCGLDGWLANTGHRLSGICIDGEITNAESMESCFARSIDTINILDISTSGVLQLFAESLVQTIQDIDAYEACGFEEKTHFREHWKQSPQARLLADHNSTLFDLAMSAFSGETCSPRDLRLIFEERLGELENPAVELEKSGPLFEEICTRLEDLPLDIQTGKDARAAETVRIFSGLTEKFLRIVTLLKTEGALSDDIIVENMPVSAYIEEFSIALRELLAAYEQRDTVLVGDIAEYEMAPRLRNLHTAVLNAILRREP